ncbi:unnamed protein product [Protopolystoma xenopodis]|uniref:Uncharacterized protein n=1 Tax=Protopolystoma xenopodis TaxID=117903 RepID=A0A448XPM7_9PLAT|nr:unnamed protein product [Protopolystoma xenopodis]
MQLPNFSVFGPNFFSGLYQNICSFCTLVLRKPILPVSVPVIISEPYLTAAVLIPQSFALWVSPENINLSGYFFSACFEDIIILLSCAAPPCSTLVTWAAGCACQPARTLAGVCSTTVHDDGPRGAQSFANRLLGACGIWPGGAALAHSNDPAGARSDAGGRYHSRAAWSAVPPASASVCWALLERGGLGWFYSGSSRSLVVL